MYFRREADVEEQRLSELQKELEDVENEEKRLYEQLGALIEEEKATMKAITEQEAEAQRLAQEEHRYWKEYTKYRKDYINIDDEYRR